MLKIVSINDTPTLSDGDGAIRGDLTDIGKILDNIDEANGRLSKHIGPIKRNSAISYLVIT